MAATRVREPAIADACPGVLRLHAAADGHMARVRVPGGRLDAHALDALAEAASLGSDIVELTSRAGLQVRGLPEDSAGALADVLARGGLLPSVAHDRVRNILAAPLAGRGPAALADVDQIVDALDRALCADATFAELPGRFLFAVDDGTRALEQQRADVELAAERGEAFRSERGGTFRLHLDGLATSLAVAPAQAPDAALRAAHAFLALRREDAGGAWRVRELQGGARRLARDLGLDVSDAGDAPGSAGGAAAPGARRLGIHVQRDGLFAVAALPPLARLGRGQLVRLAELARASAAGVRVSPWRTLTFVDVPAPVATGLLDDLQAIGLIASDASGWAGLSACAGLRACARALVDVRAAAAGRALVRDATSPAEHWSGCERRCGEPPDAPIRVVATEHGLVTL
ncbi:MAG: precorrin-3B synthase [Solirubrobacteraceae bacterium]